MGDEKGMALVMAILLLTLLASLGLWLMMESQGELRVTQSNERREATYHLAESGVWIGVHAIEALSLRLPQNNTAIVNVTPGRNGTLSYLASNQNMTSPTYQLTPDIYASRYFFNPTPPAGWMLNWQGSSAYHTEFYLARGRGNVQLPAAKGSSISVLFSFIGKPTR
jgi:hypothetical protein